MSVTPLQSNAYRMATRNMLAMEHCDACGVDYMAHAREAHQETNSHRVNASIAKMTAAGYVAINTAEAKVLRDAGIGGLKRAIAGFRIPAKGERRKFSIYQGWFAPYAIANLIKHAAEVSAAQNAPLDQIVRELTAELPKATPVKVPPTRAESGLAKARVALEHWQRKAKLAQTKIRKYRTKARYYEKQIEKKKGEAP